ncbi:pentapeptide repeat-containing protein [Photorhabdus sp. SF281]|uniref:pentapeptide repeat-containing protein n=1 Tax=Photorhabdus sp. SF281 TaxID=3459527 RepID=UPI0040441212
MMSRKLKKDLRERWSAELDFQINNGLKKENWKDKEQPNVRWLIQPFGLTELGKADFRGFPFREPLKYQYVVEIDFSFSQAISEKTEGYGFSRGLTGFSNLLFERCDFIEADLPANLSEKFICCNFQGASFNACRINACFEGCDFTNSKLKDVLVRGKKFINCNFNKANLSKANFYSCFFESCSFDETKFSGSNFSGSTFISTRPSDSQLASCSLAEKIKFS